MKITMETTNGENKRVVSIEVDSDDLDIFQVIEDLVEPVLRGIGFHPNSINEALNNLREDGEDTE